MVRGYVVDRSEFNEIRMRLPRSVRREVRPAPEGHVGLIAQAVTEDGGLPISALYDTAPVSLGRQRLRRTRAAPDRTAVVMTDRSQSLRIC